VFAAELSSAKESGLPLKPKQTQKFFQPLYCTEIQSRTAQ
jgi:hypothetical protein